MIAFISCKETNEEFLPDPEIVNPLTDFEMTKDPENAFKYSFKNLSSKFKRVEWRFGDDTLSTAVDPVHIYKGTGNYSVELRTYSETGNVSRKLAVVNINPDSVMQITAERTGVLNQVKLGVKVKAPIEAVAWTFNDVTPATTSNLLNPLKTYEPSTLNTVSARVTTKDGSVVTLRKTNATSNGFVTEITKERLSYTVSAENNYNAAEASQNIVDGNTETKFVIGGRVERAFNYPFIVTLNYSTPQEVKMYAVGNSNDLPNRDPKAWIIQGSNDGTNWETVDSRLMTKTFYAQMTDKGATTDIQRYKQLFYYGIENPKAFKSFRISISANWGEATMQINEWRLYK
ncbi:MAG: hypothetical protein EOO92_00605 [Pedobacter sp.]|nr:MAG: hypothetical protein EOO92_00605 [Pedobacter sp.]